MTSNSVWIFTNKESIAWYEERAYQWARLGDAYGWADSETKYRLTEFLIDENTPMAVVFAKRTAKLIDWIEHI